MNVKSTNRLVLLMLIGVLLFIEACSAQSANISSKEKRAITKADSISQIVKNNPDDIEKRIELAKAYYNLAMAHGKEKYINKAETHFRKVLENDENHALAYAYLGSLTTVKGKHAYAPWKKLDYVEKGCDLMDKAVDIAPQNVGVRMVRAFNNLELPDFFNRIAYAIEDLTFLRNSRAWPHLNKPLQAEVLYSSGLAFQKSGNKEKAREMFKKTLALNVSEENTFKKKAKIKLKALSQ